MRDILKPLTPHGLDQEIRELVAATAPRVFAVVEQTDDHQDAWVLAWGLAFAEEAVTVSPSRAVVAHRTADSACRFYRHGGRVVTLRWPEAAPEPDETHGVHV